MNVSDVLLVLMVAAVSASAVSLLGSEVKPILLEVLNRLRQTGDSSLSPRAVNWLGATAFGGALLICLVSR